jgi:hypothetical protein
MPRILHTTNTHSYVVSNDGTNLALVDDLSDEEAKSLIEKYWSKEPTDLRSVFIGVSGAGKTHNLFQLCKTRFTFYTTAATAIDTDHYFSFLRGNLSDLPNDTNPGTRSKAAVLTVVRWIIIKWITLLHLICWYQFQIA